MLKVSQYKKITLGVLCAALMSGLTIAALFSVFNKDNLAAVSANNFNAGNIIDDSVFYNKDAMSASDIQRFLNQLIPNCNTWNSASFVDGSGQTVGAPYVCLNNYHENPTTKETSFEKGGGAFAGGMSASQIIYNASQTYGINPQVLLVMLKKESLGPLTSDTWPTKYQYKFAMGYACPDSGPGNTANCDEKKAGFYNQINLAAWQLKYYKDNIYSYNYKPYQTNYIQYSPNASCGGKNVYIENMATASLYIYTPYTPNDGALANYPGTASCGAYGNRNFFMFFTQWFGSTYNTGANEIVKKYESLGGNNSFLGKPQNSISSAVGGGLYQRYDNGYILWHKDTGAHYTYGSIRARYSVLGNEGGRLGYPVNDEQPTVDNTGKSGVYQRFQNGYIIGSNGNYFETSQKIRVEYCRLGCERGTLGFPTSGEIPLQKGAYQTFSGGTIYHKSNASKSYTVTNKEIQGRYSLLNETSGILGHPVQDEKVSPKNKDSLYIKFDNGYIMYTPKTGANEIKGSIRNLYSKLGNEHGKLGFPTSGEIEKSDKTGVIQKFEGGQIDWTYNKGESGAKIIYN